MSAHFIFKLFNSIKEPGEVDFAELELRSLFGEVQRVKNFFDITPTTPFQEFFTDDIRLQDVLLYEPCYGDCQGFYGVVNGDAPNILKLLRRLAYTKELLIVANSEQALASLKELSKERLSRTVRLWRRENYVLCRAITNQYFLEKSHYISKLSRNEREIDANLESLLNYPFEDLYRIPASSTMSVGKRLEDYFAIREEISLYLTHMLHPYKGKFHAKMVRALLNYIHPVDNGPVLDNFAGSGTLNVEATLMGLDNIGVEINPLSALMANVKCNSLSLEPEEIRQAILVLLEDTQTKLTQPSAQSSGTVLLFQEGGTSDEILKRKTTIPNSVLRLFKNNVEQFIITQKIIITNFDGAIRDFLLLGLSGTISDLARRSSVDFSTALRSRLYWMYLRVYLFRKLNEVLGINLGESVTYVGDTRDLRHSLRGLDGSQATIEMGSITGILNSPPYSTALDYIRNDLPQLTILEMVRNFPQIEHDLIGNPNLRFYPEELHEEIIRNHPDFDALPSYAKEVIGSLLKYQRRREALRTYKFYKDMRKTLSQMFGALRLHSKAVVILGNNHYKLDGEYQEVQNDKVIIEMARDLGFSLERSIRRDLEKTMTGMIRYESVIILLKPAATPVQT